MRLDSLYYFTEVAKDLHITRTAERLFMSQQTLSNHIARLEQYYGTKLLERKPKLSLTYAGELVLEFAKRATRQNSNLKSRIAEIQQEQQGPVRFAAASLRVDMCLPGIMGQFGEEYPHVEVRVINAATDSAVRLVLEDEADVALTLSVDNPEIVSRRIISDQVFLCVSDRLLKNCYGDAADEIRTRSEQGAVLSDFAKLPFCLLDNKLGKLIRGCFSSVGLDPIVHMVTPSVQTGALVGFRGTAAFFSTRASLVSMQSTIPNDLDIFPLFHEGRPFTHDLYLIHRLDKYLPQYMMRFIELIEDFFRIAEVTPVGPCARDQKETLRIPQTPLNM